MSETIVLVTGANQGLGLLIVKKLAAENANFKILLCARSIDKGKTAAASITNCAAETSVEAIELDVSSDDSIAHAAKEVEKMYGRLDVLVNNAGIAQSPSNSVREEMTKIFDTNVFGVVAVTEAFVPLLRKAAVPRIVIMSSDLGSITNTVNPDYAHYDYLNIPYKASKSAVNMVGATLSVQYAKEGFKVNLCNPGFRATAFNAFSEHAADPADGALNACRLVTIGKDGPNGTYSEIEGPIGW